ncbi:MAG TPA: hypothetical protein VGC41_16030 [Kofleriaceae bacterium]
MRTWLFALAIVGGGIYAMRGCLSPRPAPDTRIVERVDDLCTIARRNISTPEQGVRAWGTYLGKHLGDITGDFGELVVVVDRADDPDARALSAHEKLKGAVLACEQTLNDFSKAIEGNQAARELLQKQLDRTARAMSIILSGHANGGLIPAELSGAIQRLEQAPQH